MPINIAGENQPCILDISIHFNPHSLALHHGFFQSSQNYWYNKVLPAYLPRLFNEQVPRE